VAGFGEREHDMSFVQGIEPELQQPPPRRIRKTSGEIEGGWRVWGCIGVFVLPFLLTGIGSFIVAVGMTWSSLSGKSFFLTPMSEGAPQSVSTIWCFTLFWNGALVLGSNVSYGHHRMEQYLVEHGTPVIGRVLQKRINQGSYGDDHYVRYEYLPLDIPEGISSTGMPVMPQNSYAGQTASLNTSPFASGVTPTASVEPPNNLSTSLPLNPAQAKAEAEDEIVWIPLKSLSPVELFSKKTWERAGAAFAKLEAEAAREAARVEAMTTPGAIVQEEKVALVDWNKANVGDYITVLYDPVSPKRHIIYIFAAYEAVI
jgi:hypothetical protein